MLMNNNATHPNVEPNPLPRGGGSGTTVLTTVEEMIADEGGVVMDVVAAMRGGGGDDGRRLAGPWWRRWMFLKEEGGDFISVRLKVKLEPDEWTKDNGSSRHMMGNKNLFSTREAIDRGNVVFGSNTKRKIIEKGQICDKKCKVLFSEIGSEILKDGITIDDTLSLWHRRLGHANMQLIQSAKKESSDEECSTSRSEDEENSMAVRDFKKFLKRRSRFVRQPRNDKKTFQRSRDDKNDKNDEKAKEETYLVAQASNEVCSNSSYFSDENSSIDDFTLDNAYDKLCKMSLKIITKNKQLKAIRNSLENELSELKLKLSTLEKNKGVDLECTNCQSLKIDNEKLKAEALKLTKFEKSTHCLNEMLSNQKPSRKKLGLGFNSFEASTSTSKEIKFVKSHNETPSGGGPPNTMGGPHKEQTTPKAIKGPPVCSPKSEKIVSFQKSILGPRPKHIMAYNGGNVIFSSNIRGNIIGKGKICDNKCRVTFSEHVSEITKDGKVIGHANMRLIQSLASKELVRNLPKLKFDRHFCVACKIGKQAHASHKAKNIVSTTRCLELLHMDFFGPSATRSYVGNLYTLVIVDDYSRTDHGMEFDNEVQFGEFCNANGITHNFSAPRTPQSNGVVERKNRTLQEISRTMLNEQSLPQKLWYNVVNTSTNKLDENGVVSRNKARLVEQCYNQQEGIDYDETYALVARLESIRILLAYACDLDFKLFQMDVKSAFLNGFINEEVYVAQPPGFIDFEKPNHVYKLKKALYGLKQAPKA
nr:copia protein [Tanacetum cinerariifolium]